MMAMFVLAVSGVVTKTSVGPSAPPIKPTEETGAGSTNSMDSAIRSSFMGKSGFLSKIAERVDARHAHSAQGFDALLHVAFRVIIRNERHAREHAVGASGAQDGGEVFTRERGVPAV